jgi:hypothetical protein
MWFQGFATACPHTNSQVESFTACEEWSFAGLAKVAAASSELAVTGQGTAFDLRIDGLDFRSELDLGGFIVSHLESA